MQTLKEKPAAPKAAVATKVNSGSVAVINSALLRQDSKHAIKLSSEDVTTPRLKALMATSPEINELPDAKPGMIFNTVTKKLYDGNSGIIVVPCAWVKQYVDGMISAQEVEALLEFMMLTAISFHKLFVMSSTRIELSPVLILKQIIITLF